MSRVQPGDLCREFIRLLYIQPVAPGVRGFVSPLLGLDVRGVPSSADLPLGTQTAGFRVKTVARAAEREDRGGGRVRIWFGWAWAAVGGQWVVLV